MSEYGNPPHDPNQPSPYGQQPPPPAATNPYGQQPGYGAPAYGQQPGYGTPAGSYAHWGKRVGSYLIDGFLTTLAALPLWIGYFILFAGAETTTAADGTLVMENNDISPAAVILILLGALTYIAFFIWNTCIKQGRTGYSIGKGVLGTKLIGESTGQPIGAGMAFVRQLAHILDGFCLIGYLWPLWDAKRQTFADKVLSTVVIDQPKG